ncbi:MFS transporter [Nakamurella antarctica]|uniref:MFS transporter n=1 Tax=Nakamurella antarctica TaxID=1902245 RepID=A0A3G8ZJL2_9ACTN|nr:MFS transporter [Nakamurella antarctica]AZI56967.1 MFS transporter [Nakamurella antarctica]
MSSDPTPQKTSGSLWAQSDVQRLVLVSIFAFVSFFFTLSSLPLWAVAGGASEGSAGLVTTVMLACTVATQLLVPAMIRTLGVGVTLAAGLIALGGASPFYLLSHDLWWLLVVSAVRGAGFGVITVMMPIAAAGMVPARRRGEVIGIYGLAIAIPNLICVPVGVAVTNAGNFYWVALFGAAPVLALFLVRGFAQFKPHEETPANQPVTPLGKSVRAITGITLVLLVITLAGGAVLTFLPIVNTSATVTTLALVILGLVAAVSRWGVGLLFDRTGSRLLLPVGITCGAVGMVALALGIAQSSGALVLAGAFFLGISYGSAQNLTLLLAFALAGPDRQATASAMWNAAFDSGTAIGALLVGLVASAGAGFSWTFAGCGILILVATPLAVSAANRARV